jgi:predicted Zn-dependent protease
MQKNKIPVRLLIMLAFALFSLAKYYLGSKQTNPITGEKQRVSLSPDQEVAMGLQSAPEMAAQFGGIYPDETVQMRVRTIGRKLLQSTEVKNSPYQFQFNVLADQQTVNAFALPGGPIFITMALLNQLKSDDEIAGVLGHEIGHVVNRHSAEHMAKSSMISGLVNSVVLGSGSMSSAQVAQYVGNMMNMKYGRDDETESDVYGLKYMYQSGYKPEALIAVMEVLQASSGGARGGSDFMSSHPSPANRMIKIKEEIAKLGKSGAKGSY